MSGKDRTPTGATATPLVGEVGGAEAVPDGTAAAAERAASERTAAMRAGWRAADLDWERLQERGNALLRSGDRAGAGRCFRRAGWIALWRFRAADPRRATTLANLALTDRLAGREGRARRRYAKARRIWREVDRFIAAMQISRRARSSLFHLRLETKHWGTYQDNLRIRMTAFARETAEALAALEQGQPPSCRLIERWRAEKPPVFDDTRKLLAAALMVGVGEKIPPEVKD
ncbi:MAG: tetratricopeptide repeat-containing protein [Proteobacteria bacterium]|nr:tetratricopeptide repeat-containing protein [Pseudomonadota bacterium]